jgi:hypothetical protein
MLRTATICAVCLALGLLGLPRADAAGADSACVRVTIGNAPPPVAAYIRRRLTCMRFNGDEAMSPADAHSPKTPASIRALNCDRLESDEAALRKRFAHDPAALQALARSEHRLC